MDVNQAIEMAKNEIQRQFNVTDVIIKSSNLRNGVWHVNTSIILNNEQKYYTVNLNNETTTIEDIHESKIQAGNAGSAPTLITIAFAFSIIAVIIYVIAIILYSALAITALFVIIPLVVFIVFLLIDVYIMVRINKIRKYIDSGDYEQALNEDSVLFGIMALIFGGILTGILLLVARDGLNNAANN
ncbi:hypothetical protein [Ferroplasma acidiphilum]|jgi:hypothetical protein|uniref:hypothetical protein n=1 Tax=Ferroplasma acidiphilum TaxID=74969 RepID=UPI0023F1AC1E|nr:hypothetical protein [Ferroplasma acidiphilum]MCL4348998.1 hypothetical protein [Candidatus Thermoplasmatota archaeon]WMT52725.1 MAG: hypothetical protein RE473_06860 [Ferroplasma acidiphilum]